MKMNKCIYFVLFIIFPLTCMELPHDDAVKFFEKRYVKETKEVLTVIVDNGCGDYSYAQVAAASQILNQRAGLLKDIELPSDDPTIAEDPIIAGSKIIGMFLIAWTVVEAIIAYNTISQNEWDGAKNTLGKLKLLARKTGDAMFCRLGQVINNITFINNQSQSKDSKINGYTLKGS